MGGTCGTYKAEQEDIKGSCRHKYNIMVICSGIPRNFVRGGVQQIQLRTADRENGDLGAAAPYSGVLEAAVIWYKKYHFI